MNCNIDIRSDDIRSDHIHSDDIHSDDICSDDIHSDHIHSDDILNINIDTSWIQDFEKLEKFYRCPLESIKINYLYIDNDNNIVHILQDTYNIQNNRIPEEDLIYFIKKHQHIKQQKYSPLSIFKYNIVCDSEELLKEMNSEPLNIDFFNCIDTVHNIHPVFFDDTIKYFQDLNGLYILFNNPREKRNHHSSVKRNNNHTKKIKINIPSSNKTRRTNSL